MSKGIIHKYAGILSAYGMALADVVQEEQEPCGIQFCPKNTNILKERLDSLCLKCRTNLDKQGYTNIVLEPFLHLRYDGTNTALICAPTANNTGNDDLLKSYADFNETFLQKYRSEFGFILQNRRVIVDDIRVRGMGKNSTPPELPIERAEMYAPPTDGTAKIYFESGAIDSCIYSTSNLLAGHKIIGPAIIIDQLSTIIIEPECMAEVTTFGDLILNLNTAECKTVLGDELDHVQLSIFSHRFMSIAEQMGR